jgi:hypothetical protein
MSMFGDFGIGGVTKGIFGGGDPAGDANSAYQAYLEKALKELEAGQAQGRTDIQGGLAQALGYGEPYRQAGTQALSAYEGSLGLAGGQRSQAALDRFRQLPGYKYALNQGLQSAQRSAAAQGLGGSGAEAQALQRVGQGLADQEYGQYQSRLADLAGRGQQSASQASQLSYGAGGELANLGLGYAGDIANLYGQAGQSAASSDLASAALKQQQISSLIGAGTSAASLAAL